jgi:hypothetical protein
MAKFPEHSSGKPKVCLGMRGVVMTMDDGTWTVPVPSLFVWMPYQRCRDVG